MENDGTEEAADYDISFQDLIGVLKVLAFKRDMCVSWNGFADKVQCFWIIWRKLINCLRQDIR